MTRYDHPGDVRRFGAKAAFVDSSNRGSDTRTANAFAACLEFCCATKHDMHIPPSPYGYWLGDGPGMAMTAHGVHVKGAGRRATRVIHEPASANQVTWDMDTGGVHLEWSVTGVNVEGFEGAYAGTRQPKIAFRTNDGSEWRIGGCGTINWVASSGLAEGLVVQGKELGTVDGCRFFADQPIRVGANPYENIDIDTVTFRDVYCGVYGVGASAFKIDADLNVLNTNWEGTNVWTGAQHPVTGVVGGKYGLNWTDATGSTDGDGLRLQNIRCEQFPADATGASFLIDRTGSGVSYAVSFENCAACFAIRGWVLNGTSDCSIEKSRFLRFENQGTSPLAIEIGAKTQDLVLRKVRIPKLGGGTNLYSFDGALTRKDRSQETLSYSQLYQYEHWSDA